MGDTTKKIKTDATKEVLKYMVEHNGISQIEASEKFGATRLSAIVFRLKKQGHNVDKRWHETVTRYGKRTRYAEYYLVK